MTQIGIPGQLEKNLLNDAFSFVTGKGMNGGYLGIPNVQLSISGNIIYAVPFINGQSRICTSIMGYLQTVLAGTTKFKFAIYDCDENKLPGKLLIAGNEITKLVSYSGSLIDTISFTLDPGLYWFCIMTDTTPAINIAAFPSQKCLFSLGILNTFDVPNDNPYLYLTAAKSYASGYPETFPAYTYSNTTGAPAIYLFT